MRIPNIEHEQRVRAQSVAVLSCGASCGSVDPQKVFSPTAALTPGLPICDQPRRAVRPIPASQLPKGCRNMNIDKTAPSGASTTSTRLAQEQTPAPATTAGSSPATGSPDSSGIGIHDAQASMRAAAAIFMQAQTLALDASARPEVRIALAEGLLAELARALMRVALGSQTCAPSALPEPDP